LEVDPQIMPRFRSNGGVKRLPVGCGPDHLLLKTQVKPRRVETVVALKGHPAKSQYIG
jgi:hypothetical protein